jgi:hypothetical protein
MRGARRLAPLAVSPPALLMVRLFGDGLHCTQCQGRNFIGCTHWWHAIERIAWLAVERGCPCGGDLRHPVARAGRYCGERVWHGGCKSHFSTETGFNSSGHKAGGPTIQQRTVQLNVAAVIKLEA